MSWLYIPPSLSCGNETAFDEAKLTFEIAQLGCVCGEGSGACMENWYGWMDSDALVFLFFVKRAVSSCLWDEDKLRSEWWTGHGNVAGWWGAGPLIKCFYVPPDNSCMDLSWALKYNSLPRPALARWGQACSHTAQCGLQAQPEERSNVLLCLQPMPGRAWGFPGPRVPHRVGRGINTRKICCCLGASICMAKLARSPHHWRIWKLCRYFQASTYHHSYIGFHQSLRVQKKLQTNVGKCSLQWE